MTLWRGRPRPNQLHPDGGRLRRALFAILLMVAIVVVACCLRAPITCVGPLADVIQSDLGMSSGATGTVTTVPLLMFAAFSLAFGELGRRRPAGGVMVLGLSLILVGVVCRSLFGTWGLFLGTAVTGIGITAGNVLLPAIIKARFPGRIGHLTGAYTAAMSLMSAVAGAVSVPVGDAIGWRGSLAIWALLVVAAVLLWLPFRNVEVDDVSGRVPVSDILRSGTTWLLAAYMGLQSLIYYSFVAWLSVIAQSKGLLPAEAGAVNSAFMILGIVGSLAVPALCGDRRDLRPVGTAIGTMYVAGILLLIPQVPGPRGIHGPLRPLRRCQHNVCDHDVRPEDQEPGGLVDSIRDVPVRRVPHSRCGACGDRGGLRRHLVMDWLPAPDGGHRGGPGGHRTRDRSRQRHRNRQRLKAPDPDVSASLIRMA